MLTKGIALMMAFNTGGFEATGEDVLGRVSAASKRLAEVSSTPA
jgi:hypothetical protein